MTSQEIVYKAIEFKNPERIPVRFSYFKFDDTYVVGRGMGINNNALMPNSTWDSFAGKDEWGCEWRKPLVEGVINMGQIKKHPLQNLELIDEYILPDPNINSQYENVNNRLKGRGDKYVIFSDGFTLFERAWALHGMIELFIDFHEKPELVHKLLDKITEFHLQILKSLERFQGKIQGYYIGDDWGTENSCFISVPAFREFFKFRYKKLIDKAHKLGMHVWLHSCGKVNELIEEFIDIGLDVINLQQPLTLGIEEISSKYAGKICFECPVDIQRTYAFGSRKEIEEQVKILIKKWGTPKGGFIGSDYGATSADHFSIGVTEEKARYLFEAFVKYGRY